MINDDESALKQPGTVHVSDVSALPEAARAVIAHFEARLLGARPAPGSDEAAALASMNCFVDGLRGAQAARTADRSVVVEQTSTKPVETPRAGSADAPAAARHWCYPSATIGCGLHFKDLHGIELAFLRSEVTCPTCLAQLQIDRETCAACRLGAPESVSAHLAPPHSCDPTHA